MKSAAQTVRPKPAPAPEVRRSVIRPRAAALSASPRYLRASVRLGGLNDPEEREAEHAAGVIAAGGCYQVRDPGGSTHLRAAGDAAPPAEPGAARPAVASSVVDPGAAGRVRRAAASEAAGASAVRATVPPTVIDPGASGRIRRVAAPAPIDPGGTASLRAMHASADAEAAHRVEHARAAVAPALPAPVQARLEKGLGEPLGGVRVHAGPVAGAAAAAIGARAYTEGERITLGPGESEHDLRLMAHEATHVVQNRRAAPVARAMPPADGAVRREAGVAAQSEVRPAEAAAAPVAEGPIRRFGLDDVPNLLADKANMIPGFRMFTIILGMNPINMSEVARSPANILRAIVEFLPGGALIVKALDTYGVFDKVGGWVSAQIDGLGITLGSIRAAITNFVTWLAHNPLELFSPGEMWDRAKHIFTEPIDRIIAFVKSLAEAVLDFIKDAVLRPLAALAAQTRAWDLLVALLGKNPITGDKAEGGAEAIIGGLLKLAGQEEVWKNIQASGAIGRIKAWFGGAKGELVNLVQQIPGLFLAALKSFSVSDLLDLPGTIARVAGMFGDFAVKFIGWVGDKVWKLLEIVFDAVSPGAWGYIQKTGAALKSILKNPLPFVGNLVKAAKLGFQNFADNIGTHLKAGLIDWLTGSLPGVYIPKAFSLAEFGKFALSVLGITWAQIRGKIVKALGPNGETIMKGLETGFAIVVALVSGGAAAAWDLIKEKLTNLKDMVIDGITGFVVDTIVKKAVPKLVSMFIPGAGFISAIVSIYDTIMVFVAKLAKIAAAVKAFVDSIVAIAAGQIAGAAKRVESALAGLVSLAISFLAGFLGLGDIASKVMGVIEKVRAAVDKALDTAIAWIVGKAKALFAKLFGKKDDKGEGPEDEKTRKAIATVQGRVNGLLGQGVPREELRTRVEPWAAELGVRRVGMEEGTGADTVFVENSPRYTTNKVINANVEGVYRMILDIARDRLGAAATPIPTAKGPWTKPRVIEVEAGADPLTIAKGLRAEAPATGLGVSYGKGIPIAFPGGEEVTAARRGGIANFVITKMGTYPEIAQTLRARGMSAGDLATTMAEAIKTGKGDPDILRMVALMHGAEPAREALPAATAPLLLGAALQPESALHVASPQELFGTGPAGGLDPASPEGARRVMRRSQAMIQEGKQFPAGTAIAKATEEHIKNVAQAVFQAVMHLDFRDTAGLRARVLELIDIYDKAAGVG